MIWPTLMRIGAMNYRVRIVRGDRQFEAEGDKSFVLDLLRRFEGGDISAAYSGLTWAPIPAGPGQGFRNDAGAYSGGIWALIPE
jgi:hypothetical protein